MPELFVLRRHDLIECYKGLLSLMERMLCDRVKPMAVVATMIQGRLHFGRYVPIVGNRIVEVESRDTAIDSRVREYGVGNSKGYVIGVLCQLFRAPYPQCGIPSDAGLDPLRIDRP